MPRWWSAAACPAVAARQPIASSEQVADRRSECDTLGFCTILRPLFGPFFMSKLLYTSIICIFCQFWYFDVFCEKRALLSRQREPKRRIWKSGVRRRPTTGADVCIDHQRPAGRSMQRFASEKYAWKRSLVRRPPEVVRRSAAEGTDSLESNTATAGQGAAARQRKAANPRSPRFAPRFTIFWRSFPSTTRNGFPL